MVSLRWILVFAVAAMSVRMFIEVNPFLFGKPTGAADMNLFVYTQHPSLDKYLGMVKEFIPDDDYEKYRNHCLRVMTYAKHQMPKFVLEERPAVMDLVGMAVAFHDVALWTDGELDYLAPSIRQMEKYVSGSGDFSEEDVAIAREIIDQHHKFTAFTGAGRSKTFNAVVNAVRKADWADATFGVIRFGLPSEFLEAAYTKVPEAGFHQMLADFGPRLSPNSKLGQLKVLRIMKF